MREVRRTDGKVSEKPYELVGSHSRQSGASKSDVDSLKIRRNASIRV